MNFINIDVASLGFREQARDGSGRSLRFVKKRGPFSLPHSMPITELLSYVKGKKALLMSGSSCGVRRAGLKSASPRRWFRGVYGIKKQGGLNSEVTGGLCMCNQTLWLFTFMKW